MLRFSQYLTEAAKFETEDLNGGHLDHVEDLLIKHGKEGLDLSLDFLDNVHKYLKGEPSAANISVKHDGAPAMVFGRLPVKNSDKAGFVPGQFFVATKSAFNKQTQKFITSPEDVQTHFGDRPDLAAKMLSALEHLPKVTPMRGIYQGDFMHTPDMIKQEGDEENGYALSVNPQLINYSVPADSKIGQKMAQSQFGIVVHTAYPNAAWKPHAKTGELMLSFPKRQFNVPLRSFGKHTDVHVIDPRATAPIAENYGTDAQAAYERAIKNVQHLTEKHDFDHVAPHADHFSTHINSTVKTGEPMTFEGFVDHVTGKFQRQIENPKNAKKAAAIGQKADEIVNDLNMNSVKWRQTMRIHQELTNAKHALMTGLDANAQTNPNLMQGSISDPDTGEVVNSQEGHVVVMRNPQTGNDVPVKFINRPDFSRLNFNRGRFQQQQQAATQQQSKEGEAAQPAQ
jgi:hypothetical protein